MVTFGERRRKLPLRWPYEKAVDNLRRQALSRPDYDPAVLFTWGTMMAMGVLEMLKAVEQRFGAAGQEVCRQALQRVGRDAAGQMLQGIEVPADISAEEAASLFVTWINEVLYASLEEPVEDGVDIHYCPHQDMYSPFDCRVQRYFVEGMMEAGRARGGLGGDRQAVFVRSIPQGYPTCQFRYKRPSDKGYIDWRQYSQELERRALQRLQQEQA